MIHNLQRSASRKMLLLALAILRFVPTLNAATQVRPAFEIVSIKPAAPSVTAIYPGCHGKDSRYLPGFPLSPPPLGRCLWKNVNLRSLINNAYDQGIPLFIAREVIIGGPAWVDTEHFDVETKVEDPANTTESEMLQMLQEMLKDRFKLRIQIQTSEVRGLKLVVGRRSPKLGPRVDTADNLGSMPFGTSSPCIIAGQKWQSCSMQRLASFLRAQLRQSVVDFTALPGLYNFTFSLPPSEADARLIASLIGGAADSATTTEGMPSLFTALEEQLGLKLEAGKVPIQIIRVEYAEKPIS